MPQFWSRLRATMKFGRLGANNGTDRIQAISRLLLSSLYKFRPRSPVARHNRYSSASLGWHRQDRHFEDGRARHLHGRGVGPRRFGRLLSCSYRRGEISEVIGSRHPPEFDGLIRATLVQRTDKRPANRRLHYLMSLKHTACHRDVANFNTSWCIRPATGRRPQLQAAQCHARLNYSTRQQAILRNPCRHGSDRLLHDLHDSLVRISSSRRQGSSLLPHICIPQAVHQIFKPPSASGLSIVAPHSSAPAVAITSQS